MNDVRAQIAAEIDAVLAMAPEQLEQRILAGAASAPAPSAYDRPFSARVDLCNCRRLFEWADGSIPEAVKPGFGIRALCLPVRDEDGVIVDTVAWDPTAPYAWWVRADASRWLSLDYAEHLAWTLDDPPAIDIFETPAQLVEAGGRGLVVLDWQLQLIDLAVLDRFSKLRVVSRELGDRLAAAFKPKWEIVIARPRAGAPATPVHGHAG